MQLKGAHHARPTANHECLLLVCALLFTACQPTLLSEGDLAPDLSRSAPSQELIEANASLCAQYMQVLWNRGHVDIVEDIIAEEFFSHDPHGEAILDHAGVQAMVEGFRQENPFDYFVIDDMVVSEDKVVMRGKHLRMTGDAPGGRATVFRCMFLCPAIPAFAKRIVSASVVAGYAPAPLGN